jgi:hypothetical protein
VIASDERPVLEPLAGIAALLDPGVGHLWLHHGVGEALRDQDGHRDRAVRGVLREASRERGVLLDGQGRAVERPGENLDALWVVGREEAAEPRDLRGRRERVGT